MVIVPFNSEWKRNSGYRDALDEIHTRHNELAINEETILRIHEIMIKNADYELSGKYKKDDNLILETEKSERRKARFKPVLAKDAMKQMILAYTYTRDNPNINKLLLIPFVILGFLCIYPFADGDSRVSRLLSLLLLYKNGFDV